MPTKIYINDFYPEVYIVYDDNNHYIMINIPANYSVHMYNWHQFYTKQWCRIHIHDIDNVL